VTHMREKGAPSSANPHRSRDTGDEIFVWPGRGSAGGPPHWVALFGIVVAVGLVLLLVVLHLTGVFGPGAH
jgi:hypothetical protein